MGEDKTLNHNVNQADMWMIRPCDEYHEEYKECCRWRARQFQYYVHGEKKNCEQWKTDRNNCLQWEAYQKASAANAVIQSEKERRLERLVPHVKNVIWEKRDKPLEDWNKPLPEFMERTKTSYITTRMRLEKEGAFAHINPDEKSRFCPFWH